VDLREIINQTKSPEAFDGNHSLKPISTPSTPSTCNSLTAKPMMLNFCEELLHLAS
jgi:hypothetical protein